MKRKQIQAILEDLEKQVAQVSDPASVAVITPLFNLVEMLVEQVEAQAQQIQSLKDENNNTRENKATLTHANNLRVKRTIAIIPQKTSVRNGNLKSHANPVAQRNLR